MGIRRTLKRTRWVALAGALALTTAACGGGESTTDDATTAEATDDAAGEGTTDDTTDDTTDGPTAAQADGEPIPVGVVTPSSGALASYGEMFTEGFEAGLDYATDGTGAVAGHPLDVTFHDSATDPAQATATVTDLIGQGYKIITGPASSGVSLQVAPLAAQNEILYVSGPAAADDITGVNRYTFRSGRQTYQDVLTASQFVGDIEGTDVVVFAQDYAFGQANVAAVEQVMGQDGGANVSSVLAPLEANDFVPFAAQIKDAAPDLLFVAWAGDTSAAMWETLQQQGVIESTTVVTGLADRAGYETSFGEAFGGIEFLAHYFSEAPDNEVNAALVEALGGPADIFHSDGFVAAQMIVHAIEEAGEADVEAMIDALEGWTFQAPKGEQTIRAADHAMLQPMFQAGLVAEDDSVVPELTDTVPADEVAPPEGSFSEDG